MIQKKKKKKKRGTVGQENQSGCISSSISNIGK